MYVTRHPVSRRDAAGSIPIALCFSLIVSSTDTVLLIAIVLIVLGLLTSFVFFFFNDTATTEIYTLSLHDALPISRLGQARRGDSRRHRFHHSVVDRVHDHEGRVERLRLRGIEPAGGEGHVETPAHLARRRLAALRVSAHRVGEDEDAQDYTEQHAVTSAGASRGAHRQSTTAITSTSTRRSGWASRRTSTVVLVGSAPKYSMRTSVCLKNSSISVT